jgi:hypothetical protein
LRREDRQAGYDWSLSIWQMEVSLTQIFDRPLRGREFFEEIIRDNLDLGRPDRVQLVFDRVVTKKTPGQFRTRVIQDGVHPSLHISYKNFDLKQYFKEGRGCRTEGTFRNPKDFDVNKGLPICGGEPEPNGAKQKLRRRQAPLEPRSSAETRGGTGNEPETVSNTVGRRGQARLQRNVRTCLRHRSRQNSRGLWELASIPAYCPFFAGCTEAATSTKWRWRAG